MKSLDQLVFSNILDINLYHDFSFVKSKSEHISLDRNENPYNTGCNHFFDEHLTSLKLSVAKYLKLSCGNLLLCNGILGAVDIIYRCFCRANIDNVVACEPTMGCFEQLAKVNNVEYRKACLDSEFKLSAHDVFNRCDNNTKIIWMCCPNNLAGNLYDENEIKTLLNQFDGLLVIDESYSRFSSKVKWHSFVDNFDNLIVINTFDYYWGAASLNVGMIYSNHYIVDILSVLEPLYTISPIVQNRLLALLSNSMELMRQNSALVAERQRLAYSIAQLPICNKVYNSDSNFLLIDFKDTDVVYHYLLKNRLKVRLVTFKVDEESKGSKKYLRISIGTKNDNTLLLSVLRQIK